MRKHKPLISIIVVNYDTAKITLECLNSLLNLDRDEFNYHVIVVDNGSLEPFKLPKKYPESQFELIKTENNIGFTGGNNLAISHAIKSQNSDYLLLLNSDTVVTPSFLKYLYLAIQGDERGVAVSKIYFEKNYEYHKSSYSMAEKGRVIWFAGGTIDWPNLTAFHRGVDEVDRGQFDHLTETEFATGCCMLIKREVIEEVGILDKRYFLYLEDLDYSLRAKRKGYRTVFCPQSIIYHKNAGSSGGAGSDLHLYYQTRNRLFFFLRYARLKHKITALRFLLTCLIKGSTIERRAALDFILGRMGKQPVV